MFCNLKKKKKREAFGCPSEEPLKVLYRTIQQVFHYQKGFHVEQGEQATKSPCEGDLFFFLPTNVSRVFHDWGNISVPLLLHLQICM